MRKIILACTCNSTAVRGQIKRLRSELVGHVEVMKPDRKKTVDGNVEGWLRKRVVEADFLVVFYAPPQSTTTPESKSAQTLASIVVAEVEEGPKLMDYDPDLIGREVVELTAQQLASLPGDAAVLVAVFQGAHRDQLPAELNPYRCFDISSTDAREAFLCTIVHEPVTPKRSLQTRDAAAAVSKVVLGILASTFGNFDKTRDFVVANLNETWIPVVHYSMAAVVLVLIFTGCVALLRFAADSLRSVLNIGGDAEWLPGVRWQRAVVVVTALAIIILYTAKFLPKPLSVDRVVEDHVGEWARRLGDSQVEKGGIREHRVHGVPQVWVTAQTLTGLLSIKSPTSAPVADVQRAFGFIERARIANFELKPDARKKLSTQLAPYVKQADFSKLPLRFPTLAVALGAAARVGGLVELPAAATEVLEQKKDQYFTITESEEGWGYFEQFDWGVTEIAAWVAIAEIQWLRGANVTAEQQAVIKNQVRDIVKLLNKRAFRQGGYSPISDTSEPSFARTYSTVMALWVMVEASAPELRIFAENELAELHMRIRTTIDWLEETAQSNGWRVNPTNPTGEKPFLGLTAQTLCVLGHVAAGVDKKSRTKFTTIKRSLLQPSNDWSNKRMNDNARMHDGDRYLYPTQYVIEGSTFLWYPWSVCLMRFLSTDPALTEGEHATAGKLLKRLRARVGEFGDFVNSEYNYVAAEGLIGLGWPMSGGTSASQ